MSAIDDLEAKVEAETTVEQGALTAFTTLNQELKDALANNDTARIQAVTQKIDANMQAWSIAMVTNTPAASAKRPHKS